MDFETVLERVRKEARRRGEREIEMSLAKTATPIPGDPHQFVRPAFTQEVKNIYLAGCEKDAVERLVSALVQLSVPVPVPSLFAE